MNPETRRIGDAENPYVVAPREEDYAGPQSLFPTADRVIGDAVNPYIVSPYSSVPNPMRQMGRSARTQKSKILEGSPESENVDDLRESGGSFYGPDVPRQIGGTPRNLALPDEPVMKAILQNQESKHEYERFMQDAEERRRYGLKGYKLERGLKVRPTRKDPLAGE